MPKRVRTNVAAEYLGLSESTLRKYRVYGGGPRFHRVGPRIIVYEVADLDAWASTSPALSTSEPATGASVGARSKKPPTRAA